MKISTLKKDDYRIVQIEFCKTKFSNTAENINKVCY